MLLALAKAESFAATGEVESSSATLEARPPSLGTADPRRTALWVYEQREALSLSARAALLSTLSGYRMKGEADTLAAETAKAAIDSKNHAYWTSEARHPWLSDSVECTADMLAARLLHDPDDPMNAKAARWLLAQRQGDRWRSTRQTAGSLLALAAFAERAETGPSPRGVTLDLGRGPRTELTFKQGQPQVWMAEDLSADRQKVKLARDGEGTAYFSARYHYLLGGDPLVGSPQGFSLSRSLLLAGEVSQGEEKETTAAPRPERFHAGDRMLVQLTIDTTRPLEYLIVESPLPAGCEFTAEGLEIPGYGRHEVRDERVVFFLRLLAPGTYRIAYGMRAEMEGDFIWLPARAYPMYTPEVFGETNGDRLIVGPRPERRRSR